MTALSNGEGLFYCGIAIMAGAAAAGIITAVVFSLSGRRLRKRLDTEFGKKCR